MPNKSNKYGRFLSTLNTETGTAKEQKNTLPEAEGVNVISSVEFDSKAHLYCNQWDNPGGGDCGYYALAIGMISIYQDEFAEDLRDTPHFDKFIESLNLSYQESITLKKKINNYKFYAPDRNLLNELNVLLRNTLYNITISNIHKKLFDSTYRDNLTELSDVMTVFWHYYDPINCAHYLENVNDYDFLNKEFLAKVENVVMSIKKEEKTGKTFSDDEKKARVINELFTDGKTTNKFSEQSPVGLVLQQKRKLRHWASRVDLNAIVEPLGIRLLIYQQGSPNFDAKKDNRPVVRINNNKNTHWTTLVSPFHGAENINEKVYKLRKYSVTQNLTVQEINKVFSSYNGFVATLFRSNPEHLAKLAKEIALECSKENATVASVINYMHNHLPLDYSRNNDFAARVEYVSLRASTNDKTAALSLQTETPAKKNEFRRRSI